jgi:TatD-related deoxyribonuclease
VPLPPGLPIVDHHCHLSPSGEGVEAARRFRSAGGTHLFLATQNYEAVVPRSVEAYERQFVTTEHLAQRVRAETGVVAYPVIAPYPIDLVDAVPALGVVAATDLHCAALDLAGRWVREQRAVALGEVGRPHFPVEGEVARAAEEVLDHAFSVAKDSDCPVVVHAAELTSPDLAELSERARRVGLPAERVIKHYSRTRLLPADRHGTVPSYLARRELVRDVLGDPGPWFLETDFLDDPRRPGAVLDLATVPRRALAIAEGGPSGGEALWVPFVDSIERVYGWRPELPSVEGI